MASSFLISNPEATSTSASSTESKRKKRREINTNILENNNQSQNQPHKYQINRTRWQSKSEHLIYTSKLVDALRHRTSNSAVRETADRVLAVRAKGRTRWSRAILTSGLKLQKKSKKVKVAVNNPSKKSIKLLAKKRLPALQEKARDLGRLVPGCRKLTFPNLLEEVKDYIEALEMQVRAMSALTGLFTSSTQSV